MKPSRRTPLFWLTSLLVAFAALLSATSAGFAAPAPPPGPDRYTVQVISYTAYEWYMASFKGNQLVCKIIVDHEGQPTLAEIYADCGDKLDETGDNYIVDVWVAQKPCLDPSKAAKCEGYYIFFAGSRPAEREVALELPPALVWVNLSDCSPVSSLATSVCEFLPKLLFTGQEPLSEQRITRVEGRLNGKSFSCEGQICAVPLEPTGEKGVLAEFWAYSTYGDSSKKFTAQVRVTASDFGNPDQVSWFVDVRSSQWMGVPLASCAESWQVFPPVGGPPAWLITPNDVSGLTSSIPY